MLGEDIQLDVTKAMCAAAWIMLFLILKNIILLIVLAFQRRKNAIYRIPEDANTFGSGQQVENTDDWSLAGRIQKTLANDTEYIPYFLALLVIMFCRIDVVGTGSPHYLTRVLIYGLVFTVARYIHTIGYLVRSTYARIFGFLITVIILFVTSADHVYYMTKTLHSLTYKP